MLVLTRKLDEDVWKPCAKPELQPDCHRESTTSRGVNSRPSLKNINNRLLRPLVTASWEYLCIAAIIHSNECDRRYAGCCIRNLQADVVRRVCCPAPSGMGDRTTGTPSRARCVSGHELARLGSRHASRRDRAGGPSLRGSRHHLRPVSHWRHHAQCPATRSDQEHSHCRAGLREARGGPQRSPRTPNFRLFTITKGSSDTISGLTIKGGIASAGGGILNVGTLTLKNDIISGNSVTGSGGDSGAGGGVCNIGTLTVENSTIRRNTAEGGPGIVTPGEPVTIFGGAGEGGGIFNLGAAALSRTTIKDNSAQGGLDGGNASGGGVYNSGTLSVTETTLSGNSLTAGPGVASGGGIYNSGSLTVLLSTVKGNKASGGFGATGVFYTGAGGRRLQ